MALTLRFHLRYFEQTAEFCERPVVGLAPVQRMEIKGCFRKRELVWRCAGSVSLIANKIKAKLSSEV